MYAAIKYIVQYIQSYEVQHLLEEKTGNNWSNQGTFGMVKIREVLILELRIEVASSVPRSLEVLLQEKIPNNSFREKVAFGMAKIRKSLSIRIDNLGCFFYDKETGSLRKGCLWHGKDTRSLSIRIDSLGCLGCLGCFFFAKYCLWYG